MTTAGLFALSLLIIVAASELFTNAVEWAGFRMHLASGATGSLLAALGTSLPETIVPVVAIVSRAPSSDSIAVGAILGAPFMLMTLCLGITGVTVATRRDRPSLEVGRSAPRRDLGTFIGCFALVLLAVVLPRWARAVVAVTLVGAYVWFVVATLRSGEATEEAPEPLHLVRWRPGPPHPAAIVIQLAGAVALLIAGADLFVGDLETIARAVRIDPLVLALVAVPVATELPETLNSVIWIRSRDDHLAFGNLTGSTVFQAALLGALGTAFTSWRPGGIALVSAALAAAASIYAFAMLRRGSARGWSLALTGTLWLGYTLFVVAGGAHTHG